jgi:N-acetyl-gamma-glutamyl-phosphate reductase
MKTKVFIDGEAGTTGLKIYERLENKSGIQLLKITPELRKDVNERKRLLNQADFVFLCLPDEAAIESVSLIDNPDVRVIDASTAHRTNPDWDYGFPELSQQQYEKIRVSKRVANPGCYATGFIGLIYPLIQAGVILANERLSCFGISGYSGAGKSAIEEYESGKYPSARLYGLSANHKHLREMQQICALEHPPNFTPIIDTYYSGMLVCVPLSAPKSVYEKHYAGSRIINVMNTDGIDFLPADKTDNDEMEIYVFPKLLAAKLDNLGKGACGAAIQCFDIMRGKN